MNCMEVARHMDEFEMNTSLARRRFIPSLLSQQVACYIGLLCFTASIHATVVFDKITAYHHVQVVDERGLRTLSFNGSWETRMSLSNPLQGHFEYTEYFHMPWIWIHDIKRVLMVGLGGGSTQRSYQHYYTNVMVETVELDPVVIEVAKKYFHVTETNHHKIHNEDVNSTAPDHEGILYDSQQPHDHQRRSRL